MAKKTIELNKKDNQEEILGNLSLNKEKTSLDIDYNINYDKNNEVKKDIPIGVKHIDKSVCSNFNIQKVDTYICNEIYDAILYLNNFVKNHEIISFNIYKENISDNKNINKKSSINNNKNILLTIIIVYKDFV